MNYIESSPPTSSAQDKDSKEGTSSSKKKSPKFVSKLVGQELNSDDTKDKLSWFKPKLEKDSLILAKLEKLSEPVGEELAPDDKLSSQEKTVIVAVLRQEARQDRANQEVNSDQEVEINKALDEFDTKIIEEKLDPEVAAREVLLEIGQSAEVEEKPLKNPEIIYDLLPESEVWLNRNIDNQKTSSEGLNTPSEDLIVPDKPKQGSGGKGGKILPPLPFDNLNNPLPLMGPEPQASPTPMTRVEYIDNGRDDFIVGALFGGIIGYLIGRRRGRKKTEKKLLPIKKRLEKQVINLQSELASKERLIRQTITQKNRLSDLAKAESQTNHNTIAKLERVNFISPREQIKDKEAQILNNKLQPGERIGHLVVAGRSEIKEQSKELTQLNIPNEPPSAQKIETMNRAELLKTSEKIVVDDSSLRQIYETHLIGEMGLRRLVNEYYKGGDLKKALRQEIVERQIDFERDPVLRDMPSNNLPTSSTSTSQSSLSQMIERVESNLPSSQEELAFFKAKADFEIIQLKKQQRRRKNTDTIFISTITILAAIIVVLYLTHN